jgi:RNA polymerase sigma factor (sigma-70 family)
MRGYLFCVILTTHKENKRKHRSSFASHARHFAEARCQSEVTIEARGITISASFLLRRHSLRGQALSDAAAHWILSMYYGSLYRSAQLLRTGEISHEQFRRELCRRFRRGLVSLALACGARGLDAEQLVDETINNLQLAIIRGAFVVVSDQATAKYLWRRLSGEAISRQRKRLRRGEQSLGDYEPLDAGAELTLRAAKVRKVLELLTADDRAILEERFLDNRTLSELARRRGCAISTASNRLARAQSAFREMAGDFFD